MSGSAIRLPRSETRARLETAALGCFARGGYDNTTVDQLVAAAGVSKPALYRVFESKQHLYIEILERTRDELAAAAMVQFDPTSHDVRGHLPAMVDAWFRYVADHPDASRILLCDISADKDIERVRQRLRNVQRSADVVLLRELAPHLPENELEPLAEVVHSTLYGLAVWWLDRREREIELPISAALRVFRSLIAPDRPSRTPGEYS